MNRLCPNRAFSTPPNPEEPVSLITRMSLKNRLIVGLLTLVIAVFGIVATTSLNQETMPSVDLPSTSVQATVPGASPEVVEETVTKPAGDRARRGRRARIGDHLHLVGDDDRRGDLALRQGLREDDRLDPLGRRRSEVGPARRRRGRGAVLSDGRGPGVDVRRLRRRLRRRSATGSRPTSSPNCAPSTVSRTSRSPARTSSGSPSPSGPEDVAEKNVVESSVPDELEAAGTVVPAGRSSQGDTSMAVEVGTEVDAVKQIEKTPLRTRTAPCCSAMSPTSTSTRSRRPPVPRRRQGLRDRVGDQGPGRQCRRRLPQGR
jgi:hypothetical protein